MWPLTTLCRKRSAMIQRKRGDFMFNIFIMSSLDDARNSGTLSRTIAMKKFVTELSLVRCVGHAMDHMGEQYSILGETYAL
jgi:hypothetical protein